MRRLAGKKIIISPMMEILSSYRVSNGGNKILSFQWEYGVPWQPTLKLGTKYYSLPRFILVLVTGHVNR